jgi:uncharacterized membrane protein
MKMKAIQDSNAETVLCHITRLNARRTTYIGIGAIAGLVCGLIIECLFILSMNQKWIGLGLVGTVLGALAGSLAGRIRRKDPATITAELQPASSNQE